MKTQARNFAFLLLAFNGLGALFGGLHFIAHPDGSSLHMSVDYLKNTPFRDYLIPGIGLLIVNGLFSFCVLLLITFRNRNYPQFIMAQGIVLTCWIIVQISLLRVISYLHIILALTGILLIACGWVIARINREAVRK